MANYYVYPIYGIDDGCWCDHGTSRRFVIGLSKEITNVSDCRGHAKFFGENILIVDWKSRRYKLIYNYNETIWCRFKNEDWYSKFRFTSPCEDWEIKSKGYIDGIKRI